MQMLFNILIYMPFFVSVAAALICLGIRRKKYQTTNIAIVCMFASIYFFCDAAFVGATNSYETIVTLEVMAKYSVLFLLPSIVLYYRSESSKDELPPISYISYVPALTLGTADLVIYMKAGMKNLAAFQQAVDLSGGALPRDASLLLKAHWGLNEYVIGTVLIIEILAVFIHLSVYYLRYRKQYGANYRLFFMMISYYVALLFAGTRVVIGREYLLDHHALSAIMSLFMGCGMIGAAYFHAEKPNKEFIKKPAQKPENSKVEADPLAKTEEKIRKEPASEDNKGRIWNFIEENKIYLDPDLTLEQAADLMGTNRTYISMTLNSHYGKTFREFINERRIEYAKKYILEHRHAKLEEVAEVSGFKSGAQFSRKFKEVEGVTPIAWIRNQI